MSFQIAETQRYANMAAKQATVDYDMENLEPPILTVEDAIKRQSYFQIPPPFDPKSVGDFSKGMAEADQTIQSGEVLFYIPFPLHLTRILWLKGCIYCEKTPPAD